MEADSVKGDAKGFGDAINSVESVCNQPGMTP
jgi:hypothetical protein